MALPVFRAIHPSSGFGAKKLCGWRILVEFKFLEQLFRPADFSWYDSLQPQREPLTMVLDEGSGLLDLPLEC
jgi:hypothetical protein